RESPARPDRPLTARIAGFGPFRADINESRSTNGSLDRWRPWSAGVAIALATCGAIALASRRRGTRTAPVELQVVGRASLTPKHGVYVVRVGRRVLVVGAGPQGPPSLLTELDEAAAVAPSPEPEATS
ncbi:MAG: flagellar biosynthetic protein FliO, partial [Isosphaeraceae bacterium]